MGTDNLFHKRKAKGTRELKREKHKRAPYDKVLIVTEGKKTEPEYFSSIRGEEVENGQRQLIRK